MNNSLGQEDQLVPLKGMSAGAQLTDGRPAFAAVASGFPRDLIRHRRLPMDAFVAGRTEKQHEQLGSFGLIHLGRYAESEDQMPLENGQSLIYTDGSKPRVLLIVGVRGAGKTNTAVVFVEEAANQACTQGIICVTPNDSLKYLGLPNDDRECFPLLEEFGLRPKGLESVRYLTLGRSAGAAGGTAPTLTLSACDLTIDDWQVLLNLPSQGPQSDLVSVLLTRIQNGYRTIDRRTVAEQDTYSIHELLFCLENERSVNDPVGGYPANTRQSVRRRLEALAAHNIISRRGTDISGLLSPAGVTVLGMGTPEISTAVKERLVGWLARHLLKLSIGGKLASTSKGPVFLVIDEAQSFFENSRGAVEDITNYAKMGRQCNLALCLVSQQHMSIPRPILSQVDAVIQHSLVHTDDIEAFRKCAPAVIPREFLANSGQLIRSLPSGYAIYVDRHIQHRPFILQVRPACSRIRRPATISNGWETPVMKSDEIEGVLVQDEAPVAAEDIPAPTCIGVATGERTGCDNDAEGAPVVSDSEDPDSCPETTASQSITVPRSESDVAAQKPWRISVGKMAACFALGIILPMLATQLSDIVTSLTRDSRVEPLVADNLGEVKPDKNSVISQGEISGNGQEGIASEPMSEEISGLESDYQATQNDSLMPTSLVEDLEPDENTDNTALNRTMQALKVLEER